MSATVAYAIVAICLLVLLLLYVAAVRLIPSTLAEEPEHDAHGERAA